MIFKAAVVCFLSCIKGCLTIPVPKLIGTDYGVHLMPSTLEIGRTAVSCLLCIQYVKIDFFFT